MSTAFASFVRHGCHHSDKRHGDDVRDGRCNCQSRAAQLAHLQNPRKRRVAKRDVRLLVLLLLPVVQRSEHLPEGKQGAVDERRFTRATVAIDAAHTRGSTPLAACQVDEMHLAVAPLH